MSSSPLSTLLRSTTVALAGSVVMGFSARRILAQQPGLEVAARSVHITRTAQPFLSQQAATPGIETRTVPRLAYSEAPAGAVWLVLDLSLKAAEATSVSLSSISLAVPGKSETVPGYAEQAVFTRRHAIYRDESAIWQADRKWIELPAGISDLRILFAAPTEALDGGVVQIGEARPLRVQAVAR